MTATRPARTQQHAARLPAHPCAHPWTWEQIFAPDYLPMTHHACPHTQRSPQGQVRILQAILRQQRDAHSADILARCHMQLARTRQDSRGTPTVRPGAADARTVHQAEGRHVTGSATQPATADAWSAYQCFSMQHAGPAHQAEGRQQAHSVDETAQCSRRGERALGGSGCSRSAHQAKERGNADSADTAARCTMYSVAAKSRHFFALPTCAPDHASFSVHARGDASAAHHSNVVFHALVRHSTGCPQDLTLLLTRCDRGSVSRCLLDCTGQSCTEVGGMPIWCHKGQALADARPWLPLPGDGRRHRAQKGDASRAECKV